MQEKKYSILKIVFYFLFRKFIPKNKHRAKVGDLICIRFNNCGLRHNGKIAEVVEVGWCYYPKIHNEKEMAMERNYELVTAELKDKRKVYNLQPKEYHILKEKDENNIQ